MKPGKTTLKNSSTKNSSTINRGQPLPIQPNQTLRQAVARGEVNIVERFLQQFGDINGNRENQYGFYAIHLICQQYFEGQKELLKFLIENGAKISPLQNDDLRASLHFIIKQENPNPEIFDLVETILEATTPDQFRAIINKPHDIQGNTLLHVTVAFAKIDLGDTNRFKIVELLLDRGADPYAENNQKSTPKKFAQNNIKLSNLFDSNDKKFKEEFLHFLEEIGNLLSDISLANHLEQIKPGYINDLLGQVNIFQKNIPKAQINATMYQHKKRFEEIWYGLLITSIRMLQNDLILDKNDLALIERQIAILKTSEEDKTLSREYLKNIWDWLWEETSLATINQLSSLLEDPKIKTNLSQSDNYNNESVNIEAAISIVQDMTYSLKVRAEKKQYLKNILNWIRENYTQPIEATNVNNSNNDGPDEKRESVRHYHLSAPVSLLSSKFRKSLNSNKPTKSIEEEKAVTPFLDRARNNLRA
jgi:ankyrin repeat protein